MPPWVWSEHVARWDFAAGFVRDQVVLDCACGAALGSRKFAGLGARSVAALDIAPPGPRTASSAGVPGLAGSLASAAQLPVRSESIDVYVCLETIEHVAKDQAVVDEAARVLRQGGIFICSTPNREVTNPGATIRQPPLNPFHVREYSRQEFLDLLGTRFGSVVLYGQNPCSRAVPRALALLPWPQIAARTAQLLKVPRLVWDPATHLVERADSTRAWEYLVAVCTQPQPD